MLVQAPYGFITQHKNVCFYSDTCGGKNKNIHVAAMFMSVLTEKKSIETIDHKFIISGHSHMECDTDHSVIERAKRKTTTKFNYPYDWVQLMRSCKKKNSFIVKVLDIPDFYNFAVIERAIVNEKSE